MRVLILEQEFQGHHYLYLSHIIPALAGLVDEVVVATTERGARSLEYEKLLAPLADRFTLDASLPPSDPSLSLRTRFELRRNINDAVRRVKPDYLLVPSGDGPTLAMGLARAAGRGGVPGRIPAEVGIHYGYGLAEVGAKNRLKDLIYAQAQRLSPWEKIHYVSLTNYEWIRSLGGSLARRATLLPDPIRASPRYGKAESRRRLDLPAEGRYIGLAALLDRRKAIPEFLAAFRRAAEPGDRLLLAGRMDPVFARLIETDYQDLIREERLILRGGYFDQTTLDLVLGALDVVCSPYPGFGQLSATMLQGVAAGRPVLVSDFGWMRVMVRRFGFGTTCEVRDPTAFAAAIRSALDQAGDYRETEATRRLLEFHAPANFTESWLEGIRQTLGLPPSATARSWDTVVAALPQGAAEG